MAASPHRREQIRGYTAVSMYQDRAPRSAGDAAGSPLLSLMLHRSIDVSYLGRSITGRPRPSTGAQSTRVPLCRRIPSLQDRQPIAARPSAAIAPRRTSSGVVRSLGGSSLCLVRLSRWPICHAPKVWTEPTPEEQDAILDACAALIATAIWIEVEAEVRGEGGTGHEPDRDDRDRRTTPDRRGLCVHLDTAHQPSDRRTRSTGRHDRVLAASSRTTLATTIVASSRLRHHQRRYRKEHTT
jgi:hypothetical protein